MTIRINLAQPQRMYTAETLRVAQGGGTVVPLARDTFMAEAVAPRQVARAEFRSADYATAEAYLVSCLANEPTDTPAIWGIAESHHQYYVCRGTGRGIVLGDSFRLHTVGEHLTDHLNNCAVLARASHFRTTGSPTLRSLGIRTPDWLVQIENQLLAHGDSVVMHHCILERKHLRTHWSHENWCATSISLPEPTPVTVLVQPITPLELRRQWSSGQRHIRAWLLTEVFNANAGGRISIIQHAFRGKPIHMEIVKLAGDTSFNVKIPVNWFYGRFSYAAKELAFPPKALMMEMQIPFASA